MLVAHCFISVYEVTFVAIFKLVSSRVKRYRLSSVIVKFIFVIDDHRYDIYLFLRRLLEERWYQQAILHEPWINGN